MTRIPDSLDRCLAKAVRHAMIDGDIRQMALAHVNTQLSRPKLSQALTGTQGISVTTWQSLADSLGCYWRVSLHPIEGDRPRLITVPMKEESDDDS